MLARDVVARDAARLGPRMGRAEREEEFVGEERAKFELVLAQETFIRLCESVSERFG